MLPTYRGVITGTLCPLCEGFCCKSLFALVIKNFPGFNSVWCVPTELLCWKYRGVPAEDDLSRILSFTDIDAAAT
jgi:hypothetical protein